MYILQRTVNTGGSSSASSAASTSFQDGNGFSTYQLDEGSAVSQDGTCSWSSSGSYHVDNPASANLTSSSYSMTGSSDSGGSSSGGTTAGVSYPQTAYQSTAGTVETVAPPAALTLATTSVGTDAGALSTFTTTSAQHSTAPTLTGEGTARSTATTDTTYAVTTSSTDPGRVLSQTLAASVTLPGNGHNAVADGTVIVAQGEEAWVLRQTGPFTGLWELSAFATRVSGSYVLPESTSGTASVGLLGGDLFSLGGQSLQTASLTETIYGADQEGTSQTTGLDGDAYTPPSVVPNATAQSTYDTVRTSSSTYTRLGHVNAPSSTDGVLVRGASATYASTVYFDTQLALPAFAFDARGRITGASASVLDATGSTVVTGITFATSGGAASTVTPGGISSGSGSTFVVGVPCWSATSFLPAGTILEATFDPAVRFGTDGKYDAVDGPGASWFYPWWSQVWGGLWMPLTYADARTATYQETISTADPGDTEDTFASATGPVKTAAYRWSGGGVSITTSFRTGTGSADSGSGSTQFTLQAAGTDDASYFVSRGADPGGCYVVGGAQWASQPAQLWLGSGIWGLTSYDASGGSTSGKLTVTDPVSTSPVDTSLVVAAQPIPAWACCPASPADPCLAVFTTES